MGFLSYWVTKLVENIGKMKGISSPNSLQKGIASRFEISILKGMKIFTLFLFLLYSCRHEDVDKKIIPKSDMIQVLAEMHIVEAGATYRSLSGDSLVKYVKSYDEKIFATHHTTRKAFLASFTYYSANLKEMDEMYAAVISEISKQQAEANRK